MLTVTGPRTFTSGGVRYFVPRLPWDVTLDLHAARETLDAADGPGAALAAVRVAQEACWKALTPSGWLRRLAWKCFPNPFRLLSPSETGRLLGIMLTVVELDARTTALVQLSDNTFRHGPVEA